jgi:hypothetical protein
MLHPYPTVATNLFTIDIPGVAGILKVPYSAADAGYPYDTYRLAAEVVPSVDRYKWILYEAESLPHVIAITKYGSRQVGQSIFTTFPRADRGAHNPSPRVTFRVLSQV